LVRGVKAAPAACRKLLERVARGEAGVQKRALSQPPLNAEGFLSPVVDKSSTSRGAIRGRERQLIDINGGARSVGGTSRNIINGISPTNLFGDVNLD